MHFCRNNPHPARGRKLGKHFKTYEHTVETIHTPQGDENAVIFSSATVFIKETIHTPQGDENSGLMGLAHLIFMKQSTPRKGTKTRTGSRTGCRISRNNSHPARGRKLVQLPPGFGPTSRKQPTPRKGTKTRHRRKCNALWLGNNPHPARGRKLGTSLPTNRSKGNNPHPARGRKPTAERARFKFSQKQFTPRKGTKTFICRILL